MSDIKLDIGAGDVRMEGWTPIDRKLGLEAYPLTYEDNSVSEIRASHVLEHFPFEQVLTVLKDWVRTLKPGGRLRIAVPDFDKVVALKNVDPLWPRYLMGGQCDKDDYHHCIFDDCSLRALMAEAGLENVRHWTSMDRDCSRHPVSLNLEGYKPMPVRAEAAYVDDAIAPEAKPGTSVEVVKDTNGVTTTQVQCPKMMAVISMPRLSFTDNFFCAQSVFFQRRINMIKYTGAYWEQCIERVIEDAIDNHGAEWIVTLDYDTVFSGETFDRLAFLMGTHPEVDALAPIQMKREGDLPMFWGRKESVHAQDSYECTMAELEPQLFRIKHAHFGLTLFRSAAFAKLEHPWFWGQPGPDGKWGDGRKDADIYFWEKWAEAGNSLYLASHVPIGHLQLIATWPSELLRPIHQFSQDFSKEGPPEGVRK